MVKYSAPFAAEQLHSLTTSISQACCSPCGASPMELSKPQVHVGPRKANSGSKIQTLAFGQFLAEVIRYQLESRRTGSGGYSLISITAAWLSVSSVIVWAAPCCSPTAWIGRAEQVAGRYMPASNRSSSVFRGLKDGEWLGLGTDASLDRPQNPHPCVLLHAGHLAAAVCASPGPGRVEPVISMEQLARGVASDSAVRSVLSASKATKGPDRVGLLCSPSRPYRNRLWPKR